MEFTCIVVSETLHKNFTPNYTTRINITFTDSRNHNTANFLHRRKHKNAKEKSWGKSLFSEEIKNFCEINFSDANCVENMETWIFDFWNLSRTLSSPLSAPTSWLFCIHENLMLKIMPHTKDSFYVWLNMNVGWKICLMVEERKLQVAREIFRVICILIYLKVF